MLFRTDMSLIVSIYPFYYFFFPFWSISPLYEAAPHYLERFEPWSVARMRKSWDMNGL
ncbi:hypothetical protein M431DRAFT_223654 [Trichoderma harzianum CBS 226.95]|uniref:Uncharacterized protein n=1 Tax=Trichoderma harzianum CBS 226.95 TaxID=983964 RepID=A0A2T4A3K2_TRIHA|nr:hypothetical protein M431DRAFT_223654 [Trichoderma harzianum CBS 226.95]PTB51618.1 hypothetical protein M431DRAFT_223654 [Trichoderma harzianum CBS 226.95]